MLSIRILDFSDILRYYEKAYRADNIPIDEVLNLAERGVICYEGESQDCPGFPRQSRCDSRSCRRSRKEGYVPYRGLTYEGGT